MKYCSDISPCAQKIITFDVSYPTTLTDMPRQLFSRLLLLLLLSCLTLPLHLFATHQRAAEMSYKHISGLTYELTLTSYTFTPSPANGYRDFLTINWGDGTSTDIPRVVETNLPDEIT
ncbi:MAG: hypothetical protein WCK34_19400, partial [Bacteroidota bacterium]